MEAVTEATDDSRRPIAELEAELSDIKSQIVELDAESQNQRFTDEVKQKWNELHARKDDLQDTIKELALREEMITEMAGNGQVESTIDTFQTRRAASVTGDDIYDLSSVRRLYDDPSVEGKQLKDRALKAIEAAEFPHEMAEKADARSHVGRLIAKQPEDGRFSRYLLATGSPVYKRAFTKALSPNGLQMLTRDEQAALMNAKAAERAMSLTTTSGGFAVPFVLDPTIIPTSSGAVNPYRQISNVINITVDEWRGVSSGGITPAFQAEAAATTDVSPTLAQPVVSTEMARATIPYSIEIGMDWGGFASEMASEIQDGKDVLEATKFAVGSGTNEPFGVITGATTVFTAADTDSLVLADIYSWHNSLPPRFRNGAVATFNNNILDKIRQIDTAGGSGMLQANIQLRSAAQVATMQDGRAGVDLFGHPVYEASGQSAAVTTGQLIGVIGDYGRYYKIVDRVGLNVEVVQHLQDATTGFPTGQRALFAYWRVGAKVLHANAFRTLKLA